MELYTPFPRAVQAWCIIKHMNFNFLLVKAGLYYDLHS